MPDAGPANVVAGTLAGVIDRVGSNLSGIAQGTVTAAQDLVARVAGSDRPQVSPTGSSTTRKVANEVRSATSMATDGLQGDRSQRQVRRHGNREGGQGRSEGHGHLGKERHQRDRDDRQAGWHDDRPHGTRRGDQDGCNGQAHGVEDGSSCVRLTLT